MPTNQTPGALGEEALDIALVLRTAKPGTEYRIAYLALEAAINRLRDMAFSGAKDAEALDWLGHQFVTVRIPLRYGSKECFMGSPDDNDGEPVPWDIRGKVHAAIAATKRG